MCINISFLSHLFQHLQSVTSPHHSPWHCFHTQQMSKAENRVMNRIANENMRLCTKDKKDGAFDLSCKCFALKSQDDE